MFSELGKTGQVVMAYFRVTSQHLSGGLYRNSKIFVRDCQCPSWGLKTLDLVTCNRWITFHIYLPASTN